MADTDDQLLARLRDRVATPNTRVDMGSTAVFPVAKHAAIVAAEERLGFTLPRFYVRVLTEVVNGGFGPGYGIVGLPPDGHVDSNLRSDPVEDYFALRKLGAEDQSWAWPRGLISLCHWGCGIWSYLDCEHAVGRVLAGEALNESFEFREGASSIREWLERWVSGVQIWDEMYERAPGRPGINPFTKQPMEVPAQRPRGTKVDLRHRT